MSLLQAIAGFRKMITFVVSVGAVMFLARLVYMGAPSEAMENFAWVVAFMAASVQSTLVAERGVDAWRFKPHARRAASEDPPTSPGVDRAGRA